MKIWTIWFNDGGWHESRREYQAVANTKEEAIEKVLQEHTYYRTGYDIICSEFKIDGYVIEVYDEATYIRDKKIDDIMKE